eukprot:CAMPEP_0205917990 /NCGR_PEP_ID=MMETSP1325-20131115/9516_1 /ASSEMBLY_ACC=CAM_ASM_000708 /TAXON_ID=236786 /ORGANISM="Florenciella sp., Strain RCC1007" /LENGTH=80 /DNA_ID=CAMNT_0053285473 /DNA_START=482 /DNA_END=720 /DNA_ORIENTATION=-
MADCTEEAVSIGLHLYHLHALFAQTSQKLALGPTASTAVIAAGVASSSLARKRGRHPGFGPSPRPALPPTARTVRSASTA